MEQRFSKKQLQFDLMYGMKKSERTMQFGLPFVGFLSSLFTQALVTRSNLLYGLSLAAVLVITSSTLNGQTSTGAPVFQISVGEKLHDFQLAQLAGLDEASLSFTVPVGASVSGAATMLANYAFPAAGTYTLQYQLQGMGKPGTYIQLNFKDANGHEVPCDITTPLLAIF
jgi:hypothetical protein